MPPFFTNRSACVTLMNRHPAHRRVLTLIQYRHMPRLKNSIRNTQCPLGLLVRDGRRCDTVTPSSPEACSRPLAAPARLTTKNAQGAPPEVFACVPRRVGSALARQDVSTRTWPKLRLALARHILRPLEFPRAGISRYGWRLIQLLSKGLGHARAALQTRHGLAGSLLSNPAVSTCVCQRNRKAVCSSTSGKLPTTRSSLQLPSQLRSQLPSHPPTSRHLRSQSQCRLGSQRQCRLGSQRQRRLGSLRSLGSLHRSLCSRRSHGLPVPSPEAFPRSRCRRRRTSPG